MFPKYFTVSEANACIPELEKILRQLQGLLEDIEEKLWKLREAKEQARRSGETINAGTFMQPEAELDFLKLVAQGQIQRIKEMGAVLQDIHTGLVDFPAKAGEKEVMLCWRLGEPEVKYYHGMGDGFVNRKPLKHDSPEPGRDQKGS